MKTLAKNALLPFMANAICTFAVALVASVTMISGAYVPWPPTSGPVISPDDASSVNPSGSGG